MRAVAGGLAADLPISQWFLLVAGFGSLFMVAGKRYSELRQLGSDVGTRRSLVRYTDTYLRFVWSTAAAATVTSYSLWAFEVAATLRALAHDLDRGVRPRPAAVRRRHRRRHGGRAGGHRPGATGCSRCIGVVWILTRRAWGCSVFRDLDARCPTGWAGVAPRRPAPAW